MHRKELVKQPDGSYREQYVDKGAARPNTMTDRHLVSRKLNGKRHTGRLA